MGKRAIAALVSLVLGGTAAASQVGGDIPKPVRRELLYTKPNVRIIERREVRMYARKVHREERRERREQRAEQRKLRRVLKSAGSQIGVAYGWAAAAAGRAFDCSGFTMWVARKVGKFLPHNAAQQNGWLANVSREALEPGDLAFFSYGRLGAGVADHVELYVGAGMSIGASSYGIARQPVDWSHFLTGGRFL